MYVASCCICFIALNLVNHTVYNQVGCDEDRVRFYGVVTHGDWRGVVYAAVGCVAYSFSCALSGILNRFAPVMALLPGHSLNNVEVLPHVLFGAAFILLGLSLHRWSGQWLAYLTKVQRDSWAWVPRTAELWH